MLRKKAPRLTDGLLADPRRYIDAHYLPLEEQRAAAPRPKKARRRSFDVR